MKIARKVLLPTIVAVAFISVCTLGNNNADKSTSADTQTEEVAYAHSENVDKEVEGKNPHPNWEDTPIDAPELAPAIFHQYIDDGEYASHKVFYTKDGIDFYHNSRHGFYTLLPEGIGYVQDGEPIMGSHYNRFYNVDSTFVLLCSGFYYDVMLDDYPNYEDTLRRNEIETLRKTGDVQLLANKEDEFAAKVKIKNRTNSDYASGKVLQKTDNILYKGVSQKDNDDRDCLITLFIYYSDSLKSNEAEYMKIVNTFPHNPFQ